MQWETVTAMPSCSGGVKVVVVRSSFVCRYSLSYGRFKRTPSNKLND